MVFPRFAPFLLFGIAVAATNTTPVSDALTAHEWGTFTSVAGLDGEPVYWAPLTGKPDLPCFVNRLGYRNYKVTIAKVRMETPVLYFYTPRPVTLSVHVAFPQGWITEWFPKTTRIIPKSPEIGIPYMKGEADWNAVEATPGDGPQFPTGNGASRYYAARNTDSAALRIGDEREKMIFYRGVGNFAIPLKPKFTSDGKLELRNMGGEPVPLAIVFENRGGAVGYRIVRGLKDLVEMDPPELTGSVESLRQRLADALVENGLYRKEAVAMLETWRDSWFEVGSRVIYILPRAKVDEILPVTVTPAPAATARVFVGRLELLSPWVRQSLQAALLSGDVGTLAGYGRFLRPFLTEMRVEIGQQSRDTQSYLMAAYDRVQKEFSNPACVE